MLAGTLSRYFGFRFLRSVIGSFFGVVALAGMIDYVELLRRGSDWPKASALILAEISLFRVPQLSERILFSVFLTCLTLFIIFTAFHSRRPYDHPFDPAALGVPSFRFAELPAEF